ncbi:unnamed protein product, partial [Symbiodinium natans]
MAHMLPESIDLEMLGIRLHTGDVAASTEMNLANAFGFAVALIGLAGHLSFTKLGHSKVSKSVLAVMVSLLMAGLPFAVLAAAPVRSRLTGFVLSYHAVLGFFRWVEFVLGRGPKGSAASSLTFAAYLCSPAEILFEEGKMKRLSSRTAACKGLAIRAVWHSSLFLAINSIGRATGMLPFLPGKQHPSSLPFYGLPRSLPALYLQTWLVYSMMELFMLVYRMPVALLGVETGVVFKAPLLLSTSLREFWGRRWNLLIHNLLKRSFFGPLRGGPAWQQHLGGFLAFVMSGLFHEYMWLVLAASTRDSRYVFGKVLSFFLLQFVATAGQAILSSGVLGRAAKAVPGPVLTFLVTLAVLPASPLFLEGVHGMLCEINVIMPAVEIQDGGVGLRSATLCLVAASPVAFLTRTFTR